MSALETYLREVDGIRSSGAAVPETSYYPAISNLLNEVGDGVRPKMTCVINPKNQGGGIPDGGLYLASQLKNNPQAKSLKGPPPARGVMEVKGAKPDVGSIIGSQQVANYLKTYSQVLVTNLREFVLVGLDAAGAPLKLESHVLAASEADFWRAAKAYRKTASADAGLFEEFLARVMLRGAPLSEPRQVAWFLASYAKDARERVESQGGVPALAELRRSLEGALGIAFEADEGERFFCSTFVQTLFYGVFSAWVLWSQENPPGSGAKFRWTTAASYLHVPIIGALFLQIAAPYRLRELGLIDVLDRTEDVLNSVDRAAFFKKFDLAGAVQYFYEPFLESFDPELRKRYGVWGANKREELLDSLDGTDFDGLYETLSPGGDSRFSMRPFDASRDYLSWPKLADLCEVAPINGLMEKRGGALIDIRRDELEKRMRSYYDQSVDWQSLRALETGLTKDAGRFDARKTRGKVLNVEAYDPDRLRRYAARPFDTRWCYYSGVRPLWNEPRPGLWAQQWKGNSFLVSRPGGVSSPEGAPLYFTRCLGDNDALRGHAYYLPLRLRDDFMGDSHSDDAPTRANLSPESRDYLSFLDLPDPDRD